jgi:hypothetical protein
MNIFYNEAPVSFCTELPVVTSSLSHLPLREQYLIIIKSNIEDHVIHYNCSVMTDDEYSPHPDSSSDEYSCNDIGVGTFLPTDDDAGNNLLNGIPPPAPDTLQSNNFTANADTLPSNFKTIEV